MGWAELCQDSILRELPYKIQTDRWGNLMMSPATNEHGIYQAKIIALISRLIDNGTIISECSVQTAEGVKVADVAWASDSFVQEHFGENPFSMAPEICVEIVSSSNTAAEMEEKKLLYFAKGAQEVWICTRKGEMIFHDAAQKMQTSGIMKDFPQQLMLRSR
jgi:Uma2 family endonuclease